GFASRDEVVRFIDRYRAAIAAPVRTGVHVTAVRGASGGDGFRLETSHGVLHATNVVVATGPYQEPVVPALAGGLPSRLTQVHSRAYRNPSALPPGAGLGGGGGASGGQVVEALLAAGRRVLLSVGRHRRFPRR